MSHPARRAWIGLGSNLGGQWGASADQQLLAAVPRISALPGTLLVAASSLYRSPPMGPADQPDYANAVVRVVTRLTPLTLFRQLKQLERAAGRDPRGVRWGPRALDLDLLLVEGVTQNDAMLRLPHVGIAERAFVLLPWAELDPDLFLPGLATVAECASRVASGATQRWSAPPINPDMELP